MIIVDVDVDGRRSDPKLMMMMIRADPKAKGIKIILSGICGSVMSRSGESAMLYERSE